MTRVEVKEVKCCVTRADPEPLWRAVVDYGFLTLEIPLPAREVPGDEEAQQRREFVMGLERLAEALLSFARRKRQQCPTDWH